ncbi:MAG: cobaltochelatase subunit CobN [Methanosaeta sp. PtaU1.Bin060]|nr:MAG: cobaltochelatase subunit CobN [Methanosaeta sp. PtaU1.Bin060]
MALLLQAASDLGIDLEAWSVSDLCDENLADCIRSLQEAEVILLHPPHQDRLFDEVLSQINKNIPVVSFGFDPALWSFSNVSSKVLSTVNAYLVYGGADNIRNMLLFLAREVLGADCHYDSPKEILWQGLYHPDAKNAFSTVDDYLQWYGKRHEDRVGILFFRTYWANGDLAIVDSLIREFEKDFDVLPAFCMGLGDKDLGAHSSGEVVESFFKGRVDAIINLQSIFHAANVEKSAQVLKGVDVPVIHPVTVYHKTEADWRQDVHGLSSSEVGWSIALPEFEGLIEPILVGASSWEDMAGSTCEKHNGIEDRVQKIARRTGRWIRLRKKPPSERRVAIILHNNPCASAEATVGSGAHLDTLESVARILQRMKDEGYQVEGPADGKELIDTIMDRKALSEFRWTSVEEIVSRGGALALIDKDEYESWFLTLPHDVQSKVCEAWGDPPGEEREGVPPAMVYDGQIVVTGVRYGNAIVCVQPKRGCAGARCDGLVCRILHDPAVSPPHQYLATYHWIEEVYGADVMIHVGTHGNMEFLPGKSAALSSSCFPDIAVGDVPYLYIYNSDNPPEGAIAKRRSYSVIVDHMQTVMTSSEVYGDLKELEENIAGYNLCKVSDKGRAHALEHVILDLLKKTGLAEEMDLEAQMKSGATFEKILERAHDKISEIYTTQIPDGMHIFGESPSGEKRVDLINAILRFDSESAKFLSALMDESVDIKEQDALAKEFIRAYLSGEADPESRILGGRLKKRDDIAATSMRERVMELSQRIEASDEMQSLLHGMSGGFIEPGPSGLITRGKPDVLPTGRNFYSLDPATVPTKAAWRIGRKLAHLLITKYEEENGRTPENVAMYWMASDIMWADGEQLAQMLFLMGVEPIWKGSRVTGYRVMSLEELGRPRIDITVRASGITRDCFYNCIELLDRAIRDVAARDEPPEMNYVKKHSAGGDDHRIFASQPGTYGNGVNLAVYASAWKEDKDLTDVFIQWNSFAYGKGIFGKQSHQSLVSQLKSVDVTFNKTVTDEYDLLGCCCYFGTHGGLTNAARELSGHEVSSYYGDTRDRERAEIRTLADEVRRVVRTRLLNPKWIEGMKRHGYKGAGDISKRVGRVYGWETTTQEVDDWIFDEIARTFVLDEENAQFFQENNPWAMEEIGRRLLEASARDLWKADPEVLDALKRRYLEIEGWMEEKMGETSGNFQGGAIDVVPLEHAKVWREKLLR